MFVTSYSVTYCIYVPEKLGICFHHYCAVYVECKYSDTFWLADCTRLFVQYTISLSSLCKLIWRHWTYKMPVRYILLSVWVRLSIFSPLSIIQYVVLYVFSLPISVVMIERIYILCLIIIKSEEWAITNCLELGHETMVSAVCLSIFLWICDMARLLRGTFVSWWYLPQIRPSVTDMQNHARHPTDDWHLAHMFSFIYFSVEVCLEGVFPHYVNTWRDSCVRVYAPSRWLPPSQKKIEPGDPALHLNQARGHLNWRMGLPALLGGNLGCQIV